MAKKLAILAVLAFVLGLLVLVVNTLLFFRVAFPEAAFPLAEFDANSPREIEIDDTGYRYIVYALVESMESDLPVAAVRVSTPDGSPIETTDTQGYAQLLGRNYKRLVRFSVPDDRPVTVTVQADPLEDFAVFYDINDVLDRRAARATPGWIAGFVLLALAIGLLVAAMLKSEKGLDRSLSAAAH